MAEPLPLAFAFTAGLFAVLNPCGFAMLPAYLARFASQGDRRSLPVALGRALVTAAAITAGWGSLFAVVGLLVQVMGVDVLRHSPWVSVVIGIVMVVVGAATAAGRHVGLRLPRLGRRTSAAPSMFAYGVAYAVVSLGCTLPTFLAYVAGTMSARDVTAGVAVFVAYVAGFGILLTGLSVSVACAGMSLVAMRSWMPTVHRLSGVVLLLSGSYVAYFGWYELQRLGEPDPIVDRVTAWSSRLQVQLDRLGPTRLGAVVAVAIAVAVAALLIARRSRPRPTRPRGVTETSL